MDSLLKKVYSISPETAEEYKKHVMVGGGHPGPTLVHGKGVKVTDNTGKTYIDCTSQSWALYLGYANDEITEAVAEHMKNLSHVHQGFNSLPRFALAHKLASLAPKNLNRVSFTVGGGPAIEAAMKIALKNVKNSKHFVVLDGCYHGSTLTTAAASWISTKIKGEFTGANTFVNGLNDIFVRVEKPDLYTWDKTDNPEDAIDWALEAMDRAISRHITGQVAGVIVEPIQASGGQIIFPKRYLEGVRKICDKYGCLLIFDEIQTYCRIGKFFAADYFGVEPDIIVLGKALGGGLPIAAIIIHDRLEGFTINAEELHTFANNSASQIAALKMIEIIERDNILDNVNKVGGFIADGLRELQKKYPQIGDIRQAGLHIGIQMVEDPKTKVYLVEKAKDIKKAAMDNGLILGTGGFNPSLLKIKPPLICTMDEAKEILEKFEASLKAVLG